MPCCTESVYNCTQCSNRFKSGDTVDGRASSWLTFVDVPILGAADVHRYIIHAAYGWLVLSGVLHFVVDVVSQHLRGKRAPGVETTLYYGLNTAFALGQVVFGVLGLLVARRAVGILSETPVLAVAIAAALGWLAITFLFMSYWEPKLNAGIFCVLIIAAFATR